MRSEVTTPGAVDWAHAGRPPSEAVARLPTARADCWRNLRRFMGAPLALGSSGDVRPQTERLGNDAEHLGVVQEAAHSIGARPHRRQHDVLAGMHALGALCGRFPTRRTAPAPSFYFSLATYRLSGPATAGTNGPSSLGCIVS